MGDLIQLLALAVGIAVGVAIGRRLAVRYPRIVYSWMWVAFGGAVVGFVGLSLDDGEFLGGSMTPGDGLFIVGATAIAAGLRIRVDAP